MKSAVNLCATKKFFFSQFIYFILLFVRENVKSFTSLSLSRLARFRFNSSLACHRATIVTALVLRLLVLVAVYIHRALMSDWYRAACIPRHWRTFTGILHWVKISNEIENENNETLNSGRKTRLLERD